MVEAGNFSEQYNSMIPQELNGELMSIYGMFPRFSNREEYYQENVINRGVQRRRNSDLRKLLDQRLYLLLAVAPITERFRSYISLNFYQGFLNGVYEGEDREDVSEYGWAVSAMEGRFGHLLDNEHPDSGGIFDPQRAIEIERREYRASLELSKKVANFKQKINEIKGIKDVKEQETLLVDPYRQLKQWRQEFIVRYGDEP